MENNSENIKRILQLECEFNRIQDVDILLERILTEARNMLNADAGSIYIVEGDKLEIKFSQNETKQKELPPGQKLIYSIFKININKKTISGYVAATGEIVNIPDVYTIPADAPYHYDPSYDKLAGYKTGSMLSIPLTSSTGKTIGLIQIINKKDAKGKIISFTKDDELLVMHFANNATVALQRAQMTRAIILRMIKMSALRDPKETGMHVNRVAGYAVEIYERYANKYKITEKDVQKNRDILRMAAMLHDVGKIAISDTILKKPGKLNKVEFDTMKGHTYLGARLFIDKQSEFDEIATQIALTHHEKWNGQGYPGHININTGKAKKKDKHGNAKGLKGQEIPLWGRIVAIADVYDALSSKRVYKEKWEQDRVLEEIKTLSGSSFDPELVTIFFEVLPHIKQISDRYAEEKE
ncbi:MAG: HD domain-containing protein [Spirochaetales bacterium]|nr:HD domain-containing protein [Spirochaetales bacterium]